MEHQRLWLLLYTMDVGTLLLFTRIESFYFVWPEASFADFVKAFQNGVLGITIGLISCWVHHTAHWNEQTAHLQIKL